MFCFEITSKDICTRGSVLNRLYSNSLHTMFAAEILAVPLWSFDSV